MEEKELEQIEEIEITEEEVKKDRIELDFDKLEEWRDETNDDLPVHSMISFYKASGIVDYLLQHQENLKGKSAALDIMSCNFYTQQRIKKFISERWEIFSLSLIEDNKVVWNTHTYPKGVEHYNRKPSKKVTKSLLFDFLGYCPRLDDEVPDNMIEITFPTEEEEKEEAEKIEKIEEQKADNENV